MLVVAFAIAEMRKTSVSPASTNAAWRPTRMSANCAMDIISSLPMCERRRLGMLDSGACRYNHLTWVAKISFEECCLSTCSVHKVRGGNW